jgi:hypothetical protein
MLRGLHELRTSQTTTPIAILKLQEFIAAFKKRDAKRYHTDKGHH